MWTLHDLSELHWCWHTGHSSDESMNQMLVITSTFFHLYQYLHQHHQISIIPISFSGVQSFVHAYPKNGERQMCPSNTLCVEIWNCLTIWANRWCIECMDGKQQALNLSPESLVWTGCVRIPLGIKLKSLTKQSRHKAKPIVGGLYPSICHEECCPCSGDVVH